jgi:DNA-binding transcriptional ArsR family regulator
MNGPKDRIAEILETHFCDAPDTEKYESQLRENVREYLEKLDLKKAVEYHKALGDENRLSIMRLLRFREMCVCELTAALGISQPNLTHHVKKLERAGLVKSDKRGKWVYYSLEE